MKTALLEVAGKSDPGRVRERNEDSIALDPSLGLLVVADGMGGHNSGEVASSLATDTILKFAQDMLGGDKEIVPSGSDEKLSLKGKQVAHFIRSANTVIFEKAKAFAKNRGMGTTVVVLLGDSRSLTVGHVGDSRLYRFRGGDLEQLTEDHSLVQDQVKHGLLTREQAEQSQLQNVLTRALGTDEEVEVDVQDLDVEPGDIFLVCSDGMTKMVSDNEVANVLQEMKVPIEAVDKLIEMSNKAGGVDNVTIAVARAPLSANGRFGILSKLMGG